MRCLLILVGSFPALTFATNAQTLVLGSQVPTGLVGTAGDVDGDGREDFCIRTSTTHFVRSGATGTPVAGVSRPTATASDVTEFVPVGDVDADGKDDLAYSKSSPAAGVHFVEIVSGADGTTLHLWNLPARPFVSGGADYDINGFNDVVLTFQTSSSFVLEVRSGNTGAPLFQQTLPATGLHFYSLRPLGDVDGDGYDDLGLADTSYIFANTTTSLLRGPTFSSQYLGVNAAPLGDTNANGTNDFLRGQSPLFEIVDGAGTQLWSSTGTFVTGRGLGDLDGDGGADLLLNVTTPVVLSGRTMTPMPGVAPAASAFAIGDLDGDGRTEGAQSGTILEWSDPAVPIVSRMIRRGVAGTTSTGRRPRIKTRGHAGLGNTIFFDLRGAMPNGLSVLAIGPAVDVDLAPIGAAGNRAYLDPQSVFPMTTDVNGLARCQLTVPTTTSLLGAVTTAQCLVLDIAANALGIVTSDALDVETHN